MAAAGLLIHFYRWRGLVIEPQRPVRLLVRHATRVLPRAKFFDEYGAPIDLTNRTVRYTLKHLDTRTLLVNRQTATLENQTTNLGEAFYQLLAGHVANSLEAWEEWEILHAGDLTETFPAAPLPQMVRIIDDLDAT